VSGVCRNLGKILETNDLPVKYSIQRTYGILRGLSALESVGRPQNIAFAGVISLLL
jgi:hypothetical protein